MKNEKESRYRAGYQNFQSLYMLFSIDDALFPLRVYLYC